ncbi:hypothetical protein JJQ58_07580 [Mammaliicoccus fleurettii]|uniref:Uncharacterized protein n=1 Tax=Mammaliicoccus fleurettii TaxID=150056 RepID=A0ABS5MN22_9STAP|nr:hypothetical protein [Mammaliicoccus fleurettii]MBL0847571.1 hypothetical protein [Mammaliicoccus fleurettii]MBS3672456.1 hypothetical protein [Mammaliicoccus fleurettii]MBS3697325.1 hypothetical protein [Mammaliicoccus fleurettii]
MLKKEINEFLEDINLLTNESDIQEVLKHVTGRDYSKERALKNVISHLVGNAFDWVESDEFNQEQVRELSIILHFLVEIKQMEYISDYELERCINESLINIAKVFGLNPIEIKEVE